MLCFLKNAKCLTSQALRLLRKHLFIFKVKNHRVFSRKDDAGGARRSNLNDDAGGVRNGKLHSVVTVEFASKTNVHL